MYHPSRNARKKVLCWVHTWPLFISFSAEKRKNSLSSRFSVALTDISLITIGLFQYSLFLRAREHKAGASEKKTRANAVSTHGKRVLSREIALAHAAFRSRFPLLLSKKLNIIFLILYSIINIQSQLFQFLNMFLHTGIRYKTLTCLGTHNL